MNQRTQTAYTFYILPLFLEAWSVHLFWKAQTFTTSFCRLYVQNYQAYPIFQGHVTISETVSCLVWGVYKTGINEWSGGGDAVGGWPAVVIGRRWARCIVLSVLTDDVLVRLTELMALRRSNMTDDEMMVPSVNRFLLSRRFVIIKMI